MEGETWLLESSRITERRAMDRLYNANHEYDCSLQVRFSHVNSEKDP